MTDERVIHAWNANAKPWTDAVREERIASRTLVTNQAVIDAILSRLPRDVLDVGCGEGWLLRALAEHGVAGIGVDVVPELVDQAKLAGGGDFRVASYEEISAGKLDVKVDVAVANFSLIGKEAVNNLIHFMPTLLNSSGSLVVQTLHPMIAAGDQPYADGWREGSWAGCGSDFGDPAPWFFRTVETWVRLLRESGFILDEILEPVNPATGRPASIIYVASCNHVRTADTGTQPLGR